MDRWYAQIRLFIQTHGIVGWGIVLMAGAMLVQFLLYVLTGFAKADALYHGIMDQLVLPASLGKLITRPWTLFTWPFFYPAGVGFSLLFRVLLDALIFWFTGRLLYMSLGEQRTTYLLLAALPLTGLLIAIVGTFYNFGLPAALFGATPLVMMTLATCAMLTPSYPIQLFLFGQVKIVWVAVVLIVLNFISARMLTTPQGLALLFATLAALGYVWMLREGRDPLAWMEKVLTPRVRMRVKRNPSAPRPRGEAPETGSDAIDPAEVDRILDKIHAEGYESLSRREKELLFRASKERRD